MSQQDSSPYRILLIEDSLDDAFLISNELERQGINFELSRVRNRDDLVEHLQKEIRWDVVLSDYRLPGFSATEALEIVQQSGKQLPFVVVSGALGEEKAVELIKRGAADYLLKDRLSRLGVAIGQAIDQNRLKQIQRLDKAKLQAIFDHTQDVILVIDPEDGHILEANRAIHSRLKYPPETVIGRHWTILWAPTDGISLSLNRIEREERTQKILAETIVSADGQTFLMDAHIRLIPWFSGTACLLTLHDVTEREHKVAAERDAHELKLALQKERDINSFRSEIINTLSHEFRTPLTSIQISSDLLANYHDRISEGKRLKYAENLKSQSDYLLRLLDEVVLADGAVIQFKPDQMERINPAEVIGPEIDKIKHKVGSQYDFEFEVVGSHHEYEICIDPMAKIINQLLDNSIKFSPGGGMIGIQLNCASNGYKIAIRDYGIGIPEEEVDQIFKPFFRGKNIEHVRGVGLGLFNVKRLIDRLNGTIEVTSALGQGTTVQISIPAHAFIHAVTQRAM